MKAFVELPKLSPGDQVAVISPSAGLPGIFPWVFDLGLQRLHEQFQLKTVEYPTTRVMGASLEDRARDVMAAFADPRNKAVLTSIGGSDQIRLLKHLDPQVFIDHPKPFMGYSDNTHLGIYLWNLGIPSYYGGAVMTQFAFHGAMHDLTVDYLRKALFERGEVELRWSDLYNDEGLDWADEKNLAGVRKMEPNDGWHWDGTRHGEGRLWGGCVESLVVQMSTAKYLPQDEDLDGAILFLETSEEIPDHWIVDYLLTGMGERGWLTRLAGVIVGRAKAWEKSRQNSPQQKAGYRSKQRETVLATIRHYNAGIPVVQNLDFGHTDPQIALPNGSRMRIDTTNKKIFATY